jgi:valyl-tRNA synthetase
MLFHGMLRDGHGRKMSKSTGNTTDPLPVITEQGADTLRLALSRRSKPGADVSFGPDDLKAARGLLTKLRSITGLAARLGCTWEPRPPAAEHLLDRWLLTRVGAALAGTHAGYATGDLARTAAALARLAEDDLSGLHLEARKDALHGGDPGARRTLSYALTTTLLLAHPLMPFATEELAEALGWTGVLDTEPWPAAPAPDEEAAAAGAQLRELLEAARSHRRCQGFPAAAVLPARAEGVALWPELRRTARLTDADPGRGSRITRAGGALVLPAAPELDDEQRRILRARLRDAQTRIGQLEERLADPLFRERAPAPAQRRSRAQLEANRRERARLSELLDRPAPRG